MDLSKVDIFGNETGTINTANCYVVRNEGDYCFPLIYGNAIKNGRDNKEAYKNNKPENVLFFNYIDYKGRIITDPYIKDKIEKVGVIWKSKGIELKKLEYKNNYLYFTLIKDKKAKQGENALIAIYDEEGKVIWSWHIWFYEGDLNPIYFGDHPRKKTTKNYQFAILPVNLGWNGEIGTYYQWGRKDPFRGDIEKVSVSEKSSPDLTDCIIHPDKMYQKLDYEGCVNLWDARCENIEDEDNQNPNKSRRTIKTIYDPCPPGFKVPGCDVFQALDESGVVGKWKDGLYFRSGRSCGPKGVFFPASGCRLRASGSLSDVSSGGYYWSSASSGSAYAYYLGFNSGYVNPVSRSYRAYGFSVRPFLE